MAEDTISRVIDYLFKIKKRNIIFGTVLILAFVLRTLAAIRRKFSADEMVHGTHAIGFIGSGKLQIMDQSAIWFWLTDLFINIFGANIFGIRFASIIFGSLSVLVVYLIGKEIFNRKAGLIAAVISAISSYQINMMEAGMDTSMTLFVLLSLFFFIISLRKQEKTYFYLIWVSIGLAVMIKPIAIIFLLSILICSFYYHLIKLKSVKIKTYIYACLLLILLFIPVLSFNYLLYKDKGIVDLQVARFTKISFSTYESIAPTIEGFNPISLFTKVGDFSKPTSIISLSFLYTKDPLPTILFALIGLFFLFSSRNKFTSLLMITFLIPFIFLAGTSVLPNHFVFMSYYASLLAGFGIDKISRLFKNEKNKKYFIYAIILLTIIFSYYHINNGESKGLFGNKNELGQIIDFKESISENAIVIADDRIYTGRVAFMLWDKNYIGTINFIQLLKSSENIQADTYSSETYFIECVPDDCGWGGGKISQDLNNSMESVISEFKGKGELINTIKGIDGKEYFKVYKAFLPVKEGFIEDVKSTHSWFYYPVNYEPSSQIFDNYKTHNILDKSLDVFAHIVLYIEILGSLIIASSIFYFLKRSEDE